MVKKEKLVEFLKPEKKKLIFFVLVFLGIEYILWLMTDTCAFSCPAPPTICKPHCLLNENEFLPASIINFVFSYILSCFVQPKRKSYLSLLLLFLVIMIFSFVFGFSHIRDFKRIIRTLL